MKQILINDLILPYIFSENEIEDAVCQKLHLKSAYIKKIQIRRYELLCNVASEAPRSKLAVTVSLRDEAVCERYKRKYSIMDSDDLEYKFPIGSTKNRPIIVGSGPAGLFSALILARAGCRPIILERGLDVDSRQRAVDTFKKTRILNEECNIQFGEGGAGTFSDGKLKYGKINARKLFILHEFVKAGASDNIITSANAHIGTDVLQNVVKLLRKEIVSYGGEFNFSTRVERIIINGGKIKGVIATKDRYTIELNSDNLVLAIGHSARDTYNSLLSSGVLMEPKGFGVGVRIEHPQEYIDDLNYGRNAKDFSLPASSYHLVSHLKTGRSVYSFCMCPGGEVVPATSNIGAVVTNGMSNFARAGRNANSALLVSVSPSDFPNATPLGGIALQQGLEIAAFIAGGKNYAAPVQRLEDFMKKSTSTSLGDVLPTYLPGTLLGSHDSYLPSYITDSLREAVLDMDAWMPGFYHPDAIMTGVETRSTSPVRIVRTDNFTAIGIDGLYPCGEGAGYAGGIMSSAYDGIICAEALINNNRNGK